MLDWQSIFSPIVRKRFRQIIGVSLVILLVWQMTQEDNLSLWWINMQQAWSQEATWKYLASAVLLMPLNWYLEAMKWQQLLGQPDWWSWRDLWSSLLAGISVSIATPNRIGEFAGRAMVASPERAMVVVWTSILGSICQWMAFIICGWPSLCFWLQRWYQLSSMLTWSLALLAPILLLIIWLFLFRISLRTWLSSVLRRKQMVALDESAVEYLC